MSLGNAERVHFSCVTSTMDVARQFLNERAKSVPFVVTAETQTNGRGRLGSDWVSIKGNLLTTLVVSSSVPDKEKSKISFVVALAVFDALEQLSTEKLPIQLKWPNDILLQGSKISGLLLEAVPRGPLLIGIGINLSQSPSQTDLGQNRYAAADLSRFILHPPDAVLDAILAHFDKWMRVLEARDFERIRQTWLSRAYGIGQKVKVRLPKESFDGVFQGIDKDGSLILGLPDGSQKTLVAGAVFF